MRIILFSDVHFGAFAESWRAFFDKRLVGILNYTLRRRFQHDPEVLGRALAEIIARKPDLVVCAGDLTSASQPREFELALAALRPLADAGVPLVFVPGNHDHYVRDQACLKALRAAFKSLNTAFPAELGDLPLAGRLGGCDFILVNEARPTITVSSCGHLSGAAASFILRKCAEPKNGVPRILVGHFPVRRKLGTRHRLWGNREVAALVNSGDIDLSLCGHVHVPFADIDENGRGEVSAGSVTRMGSIHQIDVAPDGRSFQHQRVDIA